MSATRPVTYERVLTLFVPARVFTEARCSSHASPLAPARHSPGDTLFRYRENKQLLVQYSDATELVYSLWELQASMSSTAAVPPQADQPKAPVVQRARPGVTIAEQPTGGSIKRWRLTMKRQVSSMRWEVTMLVIVVAYMAVVLATFLLADQKARAAQ